MKQNTLSVIACLLAVLTVALLAIPAILTATAANDTVYLGDRQDLFIRRDSLDEFGWNTAHSGEPITIGTKRFDKGIGFHCQPDRDAYVEFDISSLGMKYFSAYVGLLQEASYFMEWGCISFHVYGDGKLLASSPAMVWNQDPYFLTCSVEGVSTLKLVQNNEGGHACDAGVWGDARLTAQPAETPPEEETTTNPDKTNLTQPAELVSGDYAYVSDLYWMDSKSYSGTVVGRDTNTLNEIIYSNDWKFFPKGVGFHGTSADFTSYVDVNIEGLGFTEFAAYYGVCMTLSSYDITMANVKFAVFGDGAKLWESDVMTYGMDMLPMECDITGVKTLRIAVAAPVISGAWGTWGGAVLSKSGNVTDDMLFVDPNSATEAPTEPPVETPTETPTEITTETPTEDTTAAPTEETTETVTPALTEELTAAPTEETTAEPTETSAEAATDGAQETEAPKGGCGATLACGAVVMVAAAAVALKKKMED